MATVVIVGDMNLYLYEALASSMVSFYDILLGVDLVKHVTGPNHHAGNTLDVVITLSVTSVTADLQTISDHSLIIANVKLQLPISSASATFTRRQWTEFD